LLRADAAALPVASGSVDAVCAAMSLQVLTPLDAVLAEVRRVLGPGGRIAALVPARLGYSPAGLLRWGRVLSAVRVPRQPWPNPRACDTAAAVLAAHGFTVDSDERRVMALELATPHETALLVDSLYLPGVAAHRLETAKAALARWARPGLRLPIPLRRVLAHVPEAGRAP
ncbi:class I SAM-dependent methyltransferase, partial [Streptomonospora algeriensis]